MTGIKDKRVSLIGGIVVLLGILILLNGIGIALQNFTFFQTKTSVELNEQVLRNNVELNNATLQKIERLANQNAILLKEIPLQNQLILEEISETLGDLQTQHQHQTNTTLILDAIDRLQTELDIIDNTTMHMHNYHTHNRR